MSRARAVVLLALGVALVGAFDRWPPFAEPVPGARSLILVLGLGFLAALPHTPPERWTARFPLGVLVFGLLAVGAMGLAGDLRAGFAPHEPLRLVLFVLAPWCALAWIAGRAREPGPRRLYSVVFWLFAFVIPVLVAADGLDRRPGRAAALTPASGWHLALGAFGEATRRGTLAGEASVHEVDLMLEGPLERMTVAVPGAPATEFGFYGGLPEGYRLGVRVPVAFRPGLSAATQLEALEFTYSSGEVAGPAQPTGTARALGLFESGASRFDGLFERGRPGPVRATEPLGPGALAVLLGACAVTLFAGWPRAAAGPGGLKGAGRGTFWAWIRPRGLALLACLACLPVVRRAARPLDGGGRQEVGELAVLAGGDPEAVWVRAGDAPLETLGALVRLSWREAVELPRLEVVEFAQGGAGFQVADARVVCPGGWLTIFEPAAAGWIAERVLQAVPVATRDARGSWDFQGAGSPLPPFLTGGLPLGVGVTVVKEADGKWLSLIHI